jgi:tetratricopeptide (TPR) repeat protein
MPVSVFDYQKAGITSFKLALSSLNDANKFNPKNARLNYMLGFVWFISDAESSEALKYFETAASLDPTVELDLYFWLGWCEQLHDKWDDAIKNYKAFIAAASQKKGHAGEIEDANKKIGECMVGKELSAKPERVFVDNLGSAVNSSFPEYGPSITTDEETVIFTARRDNSTGAKKDQNDNGWYEDVYISTKKAGKWGQSMQLSKNVNTEGHDAAAGLSQDGSKLFVYRHSGRDVRDYITNPSNETPYVFEEGDRLNIYYSPIGEYLGIMDYEIKSFEEGRYIKAKYREEFSQSLYYGTGTFIEITTPRSNENTDIFYEFGECYPVNNPGTNQRSLSRTSFKIWQGDTHRMKEVPLYAKNLIVSNETKPYYFYSMSPDYKKRTGVWEKANGRPNLVLLDGNNKVRKVNTIRWSDRLIDGSKINGNSTFGAFNSIQLDFDFGPIRKVTGVEEVMIVNCESESSVIYVNESLLKSADNEGIVAISNNVLNSPRKLPGGYGCIHPESVALYNNYLYWVSDNKGTAIRYNTVNGIFNISGGYKAKTYFYNKKPSWIGGFDPLFRMQLFCSDETIGFLDPADPDTPNAWTGRYSFVPERLGYLGLDLLSFKDGVLWKHHSSDIYNNFYGQQYQSEITPIFNFQPSDIKVFNSVSIEASDSFVGEISTLEGQSSRILEMEKINQEWWSDILRDENTGGLYEGDLITSHILKIKFIYNKISKFRLRFINLYSQISQLTNK